MTRKHLYKKSNEDMYDTSMGIEDFFKSYENMTVEDLQEDLNQGIDESQEKIGPDSKKINKDIDKAQKGLNREFEKILDMVGDDTKIMDLIPGSDALMSDFEEKEDSDNDKTYESDRCLKDFVRFVKSEYPNNTPKHDGNSILACERTMAWLQRLANEISTNIRNDVDGILDNAVDTLSEVQEAILTDILVLKDHMKKLKALLPEKAKNRRKAEQSEILEKFASTPNNMVITITPFIRAITGILVNSTVSAGKPFEDVYDYLIEKYEISEREQLEILQVLMDMGQPIFKDRGTMPGSAKSKDTEEAESKLKGVDFITNYFG